MRMKNMFKRATAYTAAAVAAASLAGCGGGTGTSSSAGGESGSGSGEPTEISIAVWNADQSFAGDEVLDAIEEKLNIKITPVNVTWDDYQQKIQLWASSGTLPDVFVGDFRKTATYAQWADQGVIRALPEDLSAYPNLETYLSGTAGEEAKLDGTLYCIPRQTYSEQPYTSLDRMIVYRWDLAQKAGVTKEPETWEEFQEMILAILEADPEGTGITGVTASDKTLLGGMIMPYGSGLACEQGSAFKWVESEDGSYVPAYFTDDVLYGFQLARDMYESGVIEKDIALTTGTAAQDKFLQGKSAAIAISGGYGNIYSTVGQYWSEVHGTEYTDAVKAFAMAPDHKGNAAWPIIDYAWSESYINSNVDDAKLDKILELYDYLLSDEGAFFGTYGPEGDLYTMEDGKVKMKDDSVVIMEKYPSTEALTVLARWNPSTYDNRFVGNIPDNWEAVNTAIVEKAKNAVIPEYNPRCSQLVLELGLDFAINFNDDFLNIMTGTEPVETMWEALTKQYEADGLSEVIEQVNAALQEEA